MTFKLTQSQSLSQRLSPAMIQQMTMFHRSYDALHDAALEASESNIFLEIAQFNNLYIPQSGSGSHDTLDLPPLPTPKTLTDVLVDQLNAENLSPLDHQIGLELIHAIDDNGYLLTYPSLSNDICHNLKVSPRKVRSILRIIHGFEPDGVGARSVKECLLNQLHEKAIDDDQLVTILTQAITQGPKSLDYLTAEQRDLIVAYLKDQFNAKPGLSYANKSINPSLIPSFEAQIQDGRIQLINLEEKKGIKLSLSTDYESILADPNLTEQSHLFLTRQYQKAKEWIDQVNQRWEKLQVLVQFILSNQLDFLHYGPEFIKPLLQKTIAHELDMSQSSISRLIHSKSIQTPFGLFLLKRLCPQNYYGRTKVQFMKMVHAYLTKYPSLSDQKVCNLINQNHQINIARRTVTKYRFLLNIEPSFKRR